MFLKSVKVANFPKNATQMVKKVKTFIWLVFKKKRVDTFLKKISNFRGIARSSKLAAEFDWNSEIYQNAQKLSFPKKLDIFPKKLLKYSKITKSRIFSVGCNWNDKILQNVRNLGFFKTNYGFFEKQSWIF